MTEQHTLAIGLIGSGYMGRAHAIAFRSASAVFDLPIQPRLSMLADVDGPTAQRAEDAPRTVRAGVPPQRDSR